MVGISPYVKEMGEAENGVNYVLQNIIKKGDDIDYYENKIQWKNENLEYTTYSVNGL